MPEAFSLTHTYVGTTQSKATKDRLKYLLAQTEIFGFFMKGEQPKGKKGKSTMHRNQLTEDAEDADLIAGEEGEGEEQNTRLQVQPSCVTGQMREYQLQGLNWLIHLYENGINGILADEMGLGKTLQTISLLGYLQEYRGIRGPHLIIVPKSTLGNWMNEIKRWCPVLRAVRLHGNQEERNHQKETSLSPGTFDCCVTSYEMVIKEKGFLRKYHWRYVIIDEAHRIKNENSILSRVVRLMHTNYRLLLTGTPLQNNLHELWALLNFLLPEVFHSSEQFDEWFKSAEGEDSEEDKQAVIKQLHKVLRPFLLRRLKSEVERGLPPKKETILYVGMSEMQKKFYKALLQKDIDVINSGSEKSRLLNIVMQLRKCCNHPYLFQGAEPGPPYTTDTHIVENAGKMVLLDRLLPRLKARGSRVLIFSQMTRMLDILEDYCLFSQHKYCRIDGNTLSEDRENMIDKFNEEGSEQFIFLLSTRAGGLGINLATADTVVIYDSDWNPQADLQAMDRAHRIGQKREVQVFRFCTENSFEVKVIEKAYEKLKLDALVIQQGRLTDKKKGMNKNELAAMVRFGAEKVFNSSGSDITDEDIEAIIAKGEAATKELTNKMEAFAEKAFKFSMDGGVSVYDFQEKEEQKAEGLDMKNVISANWIDPPKRERKQNYNVSEYYRQAMQIRPAGRSSGPRLPRMPQLQDFQFFDISRLTELFEKEAKYMQHQAQVQQKASAAGQEGAQGDGAYEPKEDDPKPLTEEEIAEKDKLLEEGFSNWNKRDFQAFVRACERYGREDLENISKEIDGKSPEEVQAYAKVFWQRYTELQDADRVLEKIERGEQRIQREKDIANVLKWKLDQYKNPWRERHFHYGTSRGKAYTEDEDRFMVCMTHKLGYGEWEALKAAVRQSWLFRFDWFLKSRTPAELGRRVDTLIRLIEKESEDEQAAAKKQQRRASGTGTKRTSTGGSSRRGGKRARAR